MQAVSAGQIHFANMSQAVRRKVGVGLLAIILPGFLAGVSRIKKAHYFLKKEIMDFLIQSF
jgi:hypothetical protein